MFAGRIRSRSAGVADLAEIGHQLKVPTRVSALQLCLVGACQVALAGLLGIGGRGHVLGERAEVGLAAGAIELLAPRELHLDGERIDALAPLEKRLRDGIDPLVTRGVEVVDAKQVRHLEDRVAIDEQASDDLLLGGLVERHLPVGHAGLDGHGTIMNRRSNRSDDTRTRQPERRSVGIEHIPNALPGGSSPTVLSRGTLGRTNGSLSTIFSTNSSTAAPPTSRSVDNARLPTA